MKELAILLMPLVGISPQGKYFLIRFVHAYGNRSVQSKVKDLASALGVTDRVLTNAVKELACSGIKPGRPVPAPTYLEREEVASTGKGRPSYKYRLDEGFAAQYFSEGVPEKATLYWPIIRHVLKLEEIDGQDRPSGTECVLGRRPGQLDVSNRLILALLLALADEGGVVRGIRLAELAELAGMSKSRLQGQVYKLLQLGYLHGVVSGVTGSKLFGVVPGAYFLNLRHPDYGRHAIGGFTFLLEAVWAHPNWKKQREAQHLFLAVGSSFACYLFPFAKEVGQQSIAFSTMSLAHYFDGVGSPGLPDYLQMKIEEFASFLLSNHWERLDDMESEVDEAILGKIVREVLPKRAHRSEVDMNPEGTDLGRKLAQLIYTISLRLAQSVRSIMRSARLPGKLNTSDGLGGMHHVLLPAKHGSSGRHFVVESFYKGPSAVSGPSYCLCPQDKLAVANNWIYERDYSDMDKHRYGLYVGPTAPKA